MVPPVVPVAMVLPVVLVLQAAMVLPVVLVLRAAMVLLVVPVVLVLQAAMVLLVVPVVLVLQAATVLLVVLLLEVPVAMVLPGIPRPVVMVHPLFRTARPSLRLAAQGLVLPAVRRTPS